MILHKEDLEAIRDLVKEEVDKALRSAALSKVETEPVKPEKSKEKK